MFTIEAIKAAHSKVKSGADFPAYIQELKALGVTYYETYVTDGHTDYYGHDDYKATATAMYETMTIALDIDKGQFINGLKEHQQGKTDYATFISMSAQCGIHKWAISMDKMTCTYFDTAGNEVLVEDIPG